MLQKEIPTPPKSVHRARRLRFKETPAERRLWLHLKNRKFHGLKFRRQVPIGNFIVDFLCVPMKLIIELDGAFHELHTSLATTPHPALSPLTQSDDEFSVTKLPPDLGRGFLFIFFVFSTHFGLDPLSC